MASKYEIEKTAKQANRATSFETPKKLAKSVRMIFVVFGMVYVLYSFTKTMKKVKEGNVLVKEEARSFTKYKYPSVTFCYKYKHGSKEVLRSYYPRLYKKWKESGKVKLMLSEEFKENIAYI